MKPSKARSARRRDPPLDKGDKKAQNHPGRAQRRASRAPPAKGPSARETIVPIEVVIASSIRGFSSLERAARYVRAFLDSYQACTTELVRLQKLKKTGCRP